MMHSGSSDLTPSNSADQMTPGQIVAETTHIDPEINTPTTDILNDDDDDDDDDEYHHDQLPSVEEVRNRASMFLAESDRGHRTTRRLLRTPPDVFKILFWIGVLLLLAALVILIVGLTTGGNGNGGIKLNQLEVEQYLVAEGYATSDDLKNQASPQFLAVQWLVTSDGRGAVDLPTFSENGVYFLQRYVLCVLFFATDGGEWTNRWNLVEKHRPTCAWNSPATSEDGRSFVLGASCVGGKVHRIQIPQSNLRGTLPLELGYLTSLVFVALHHNALVGNIPLEWQALTNMDYLALHWNQLTGTIPEFIDEAWPNLRVFGMGDNELVGSIPASLSKLTKLVTLGLDNNQLTGDLQHLQDLTQMKRLYLNSNSFTGPLLEGSTLLAMRNLEELDLSENAFTGSLAMDFFQFPNLRILDLNTNLLGHTLPLGAYDNLSLRYLALHGNSFTGPILESMAELKNLTHLDLSDNLFSGFIPTQLTEQLTQLRYLFIANIPTLESAPIPNLVRLTNLRDASFKATRRNGPLLNFCQSVELLQLLDLDGNALTGTIPESMGTDCQQLQYLFLNRNPGLGGTVPAAIQELPHLRILLLSHTSLVGNLAPLCSRSTSIATIQIASADCHKIEGEAELECGCCAICCSDDDSVNDATCKESVYYGNLDPEWENSFFRKDYDFEPSDIPNV